MMDATTAMRQAWVTAVEYFGHIKTEVDRAYPKASEDARLAAVVELCKVAASDFNTASAAGNVSGSSISSALMAASEVPSSLSELAVAVQALANTLE